MARSARRPPPSPQAEPAPRNLEPRAWHGVVYRPCQAGASEARQLFQFAGAPPPVPTPTEIAWEADAGGRLVGAVLVEGHGSDGFIHGPVVVEPPPSTEPMEVAAHLVSAAVEHAAAVPMNRLFTRPQGLDRVWVRTGFVPVPEAALPPSLGGRPGTGLHVWRRPGTYHVPTPDPEGARARGRR